MSEQQSKRSLYAAIALGASGIAIATITATFASVLSSADNELQVRDNNGISHQDILVTSTLVAVNKAHTSAITTSVSSAGTSTPVSTSTSLTSTQVRDGGQISNSASSATVHSTTTGHSTSLTNSTVPTQRDDIPTSTTSPERSSTTSTTTSTPSIHPSLKPSRGLGG